MNLMGRATVIIREPVRRKSMRGDRDRERRGRLAWKSRLAQSQRLGDPGLVADRANEFNAETGHERIEDTRIVVQDHQMRNPWHGSARSVSAVGEKGRGSW